MCFRWSFSTRYPSYLVETNTTPTVPFMIMNDRQERQPLKTVSFKEERTQDKVNERKADPNCR